MCSHVLQVGLKSESTRVQLEFMLGSGGVEVAGQPMSDATSSVKSTTVCKECLNGRGCIVVGFSFILRRVE